MLAWHFLNDDKKLCHDDGRKVRTGITYRHKGEVRVGYSGLHASTDILETLKYRNGKNILCRVELDGAISEQQYRAQYDSNMRRLIRQGKGWVSTTLYSAKSRKVLWMLDAKKILDQFIHRYCHKTFDEISFPNKEIVYEMLDAKQQSDNGVITDIEFRDIVSKYILKAYMLRHEQHKKIQNECNFPFQSMVANCGFNVISSYIGHGGMSVMGQGAWHEDKSFRELGEKMSKMDDEFYGKHGDFLGSVRRGTTILDYTHENKHSSAINDIRESKIWSQIPEGLSDQESCKLSAKYRKIEDAYIRKSLVGMINAGRRKCVN